MRVKEGVGESCVICPFCGSWTTTHPSLAPRLPDVTAAYNKDPKKKRKGKESC